MFSSEPTSPVVPPFDWDPFLEDLTPLPSSDLTIPTDSSFSSDPTTPSPRGRKRKHDEPLTGTSSQQDASGGKRQRAEVHFSCPYRKRNPGMFNVRDFQTCANQSFSSITLLKRHIMSAHQSKDFNLQCTECGSWFRSQKALDGHSTAQTCSSLPRPAIDEFDRGITEDMEHKLRDRRFKSQVSTWDAVWQTIFPNGGTPLDPDFVPILEGQEAREQFYKNLAELDCNALSSVRGVLAKSNALDLVEVVRKVHHIVDTSPPRTKRAAGCTIGMNADDVSMSLFR